MDFDIVILAGGQSSRMNFIDKGLLTINGKKLIAIITNTLKEYNQQILISCNQNFAEYKKYGNIIIDITTGFIGPMAGLHSATQYTKKKYLLILAVDTPFIEIHTIKKLITSMDDNTDICVAFDGEKIHPTIMFLRADLKENIANFIERGERKLGLWIRGNKYKKVLITNKRSLTNLNSPEDFKF